jgi:hypothetical protein
MDGLLRQQVSAEDLFHDEYVFEDVLTLLRGMLRRPLLAEAGQHAGQEQRTRDAGQLGAEHGPELTQDQAAQIT